MPTYADLKARVERELNIEDEDFVNDAELMSYANRAINSAESIILNLNEDYFLAEPATITLVNGTASYDLPTDIYANKIKLLIYDNGSTNYQIKKLKALADIPNIQSADLYQYVLTSSSTNGTRIRLYPTPAENGALITIWYLRNAETIDADTDSIDLPEAYDYITQYIKDMVINKERNTPDAPPSANLMKAEEMLIASLHQRTLDEPVVSEEEVQNIMDEVI